MSNKWIPGPPTQPGWYWLRYKKFNYINGNNPKPFVAWVGRIKEDQIHISDGHDWTGKKLIAAHSPIQEPEDA